MILPLDREYLLLLIVALSICYLSIATTAEKSHTNPMRCLSSSPTDMSSSQPKIAVAFFGISRNLQLTMPLFEKYVFDVLSKHGIQSDVFWHTVTKPSISNLHTTEKNQELNRFDVQVMNPCVFELADEGLIKDIEFESFRKSRFEDGGDSNNRTANNRGGRKKTFDPFQKFFHDNYESLKNMLCSFYSQYRLHLMITSRMHTLNMTYDAILVLRPDTGVFFQDIDLPLHLSNIRSGKMKGVWTPNFQRWKGLNDRFAYGDTESMLLYLQRGERYKQKADKLTEGSGEKFLKKYLRRHKVSTYDSSVRVMRVRASGVVARKDCLDADIVREYGDQLQRCVTWVQRKYEGAAGAGTSSAGAVDTECRIRDIHAC